MKKNLTLMLFYFINCLFSSAYSQIKIDAGNDTTLCINHGVVIGGIPTASEGAAPYTYKWDFIVFDKQNNRINDKVLVDSDTIPNPRLNGILGSQDAIIKCLLKVQDQNGEHAIDSVKIINSYIAKTTLIFSDINIDQSDTCQLKIINIKNGFPPFKYSWSPNYNLSDSSISSPKAWPYYNTEYMVEVTDSVGCKGKDFVIVHVNPLAIDNKIQKSKNYLLSNNPIIDDSKLVFSTNFNNATLIIYNLKGEIIFEKIINTNIIEIGKLIQHSGLYIFLLQKENYILSSGKIIR